MSNARVKFSEATDYLATLPAFTGHRLGSCYDFDYIEKMELVYPAIWFVGSQTSALDDGSGFSGLKRQKARVEILARLVVERAVPGEVNREDAIDTLIQAYMDAMFGWVPSNAVVDVPFSLVQCRDGIPYETVAVADVTIASTVIFTKQQ